MRVYTEFDYLNARYFSPFVIIVGWIFTLVICLQIIFSGSSFHFTFLLPFALLIGFSLCIKFSIDSFLYTKEYDLHDEGLYVDGKMVYWKDISFVRQRFVFRIDVCLKNNKKILLPIKYSMDNMGRYPFDSDEVKHMKMMIGK